MSTSTAKTNRMILDVCMSLRPWRVEPGTHPLGPEDEDVARERERVIKGTAQSDILTMINLSKV